MKIVDLRIGDLVADENGTLGKVVKFTRDDVAIVWDGSEEDLVRYTDVGLKIHGVVFVEGQ